MRDKYFKIKEYTLEKFHIRARRYISKEILAMSKIEISDAIDEAIDCLVIDLTSFVYSQKIREIKYPFDWLEAFKERWFPKWLLKKYPVQYTVYDLKRFYPEIPPMPPHDNHIIVANLTYEQEAVKP